MCACMYTYVCIFLTSSDWAVSTIQFWENSGVVAFQLGTCPCSRDSILSIQVWPSIAVLIWGVHCAMAKKCSSMSVGHANIYQCPRESWCELLSFELCFRIGWSLCESSHLFLRHFSLFPLENEQRKGEGNCLY